MASFPSDRFQAILDQINDQQERRDAELIANFDRLARPKLRTDKPRPMPINDPEDLAAIANHIGVSTGTPVRWNPDRRCYETLAGEPVAYRRADMPPPTEATPDPDPDRRLGFFLVTVSGVWFAFQILAFWIALRCLAHGGHP